MTEHLVRARQRQDIRRQWQAGVTIEELAKVYRFIRLRKLVTKGR